MLPIVLCGTPTRQAILDRNANAHNVCALDVLDVLLKQINLYCRAFAHMRDVWGTNRIAAAAYNPPRPQACISYAIPGTLADNDPAVREIATVQVGNGDQSPAGV